MGKQLNTFDLIHSIFKRHVVAEPHYLIACSLWALHTHVYRKFGISPRLALLSPIENCGKSTVLFILREVVRDADYLIDPTPASLFRTIGLSTFLMDEADNMTIVRNMRAILNAGYHAEGTVARIVDGVSVRFPVYAPVALAAIGTLPHTLISRSLVIQMHRADPDTKIVRFDKRNIDQAQELYTAKSHAFQWANEVQLNIDPSIPIGLGGRTADNWRVLIAIADSLDRGKLARDAAIKFLHEYKSPNIKVALLYDIRTVFDEIKARILPSKTLIEKLLALEYGEHDWVTYQLTPIKMSHMLNDFQIRPRNMWYPEHVHRSQQQNLRCYVKSDFETMWRRYAAATLQHYKS